MILGREGDSPVSWMTNGTSNTSCNHLLLDETRDGEIQGDLLCENERDHVSDMHAITARSPTGIQEKRLPLLVPIQDPVKLPTQTQASTWRSRLTRQAADQNGTDRWEKNIPLRKSGCGLWPVSFSNRSSNAASTRRVPN